MGVKTSHLTLGRSGGIRPRLDAGPAEAPWGGVKTSHLTLGAGHERAAPPCMADSRDAVK
jgi:hypothetical protein